MAQNQPSRWLWFPLLLPAFLTAGERYAPWSLAIPQSNRAFNADPDHDFCPNGLEFVLGAQPLQPEHRLNPEVGQIMVGSDRFATFQFVAARRSFDDIGLRIEGSGDAVTWSPVAWLDASRETWQGPGIVTTQLISESGSVQVIVQDSVPVSPDHPRFLRLSVTRQILDSDGDGMSDDYEAEHGLDLDHDDSGLDPDGDGLANRVEFAAGLKATSRDSDGNGFFDGYERAAKEVYGGSGTGPQIATGLIIYLPAQ
jgi:hypothetical protein